MPNFVKMVLATMVGFFLCSVLTAICYFVLFLILGASIAGSFSNITPTIPNNNLQDLRFN